MLSFLSVLRDSTIAGAYSVREAFVCTANANEHLLQYPI